MAETSRETPVETAVAEGDLRLMEALPRISWGAIFGGAFAALGIWLLLYAFGLAVGLSSVDPSNPSSIKGSGIFTGVWSVITPLLALFVGGLVAGRLAGVFDRVHGAVHGLVMWGLTTVAGVYLAVVAISTLISGMAAVGKTAVQAGGAVLGGAASASGAAAADAGSIMDRLGIDWNDMLQPINQRLAAEGKPAITAAQLRAAAQDAVQRSLTQGHVDRPILERSLAENTALSRDDVRDISGQLEAKVSGAAGQLRGAAESVETGALKAADATGKAFWWIFGALGLGLASSLTGGALGVAKPGRTHRRGGEPVVARTRVPMPRQREVYP